jgi:acid phosphatase
MPQPCFQRNQGQYVARHNPPVYYTGILGSCQTNDVSMGTPLSGALAADLGAGTLPSYGVLVPNLCNDGHDACNGQSRLREEDQTVATWLPTIMSSTDYRSGHLLVVITADTSEAPANGNQLATILVNPNIIPGTQVAARYDHYALLRLTEQLLGLTPLANAAGAADMAGAFNLPSAPVQTP